MEMQLDFCRNARDMSTQIAKPLEEGGTKSALKNMIMWVNFFVVEYLINHHCIVFLTRVAPAALS